MFNKTKMKTENKVIKYKRPIGSKSGLVEFSLIFLLIVYLTVTMIIYMTKEKITFYEVVYGTNATSTNKAYNALILRNETFVSVTDSGYINFYIAEGDRVACETTVYSLDETGSLNDLLVSSANDASLDDISVSSVHSNIIAYLNSYDDMDFSDLYVFKSTLSTLLNKSINTANLELINEMIESGSVSCTLYPSGSTGIVAFYKDGYEDLTYENVTASDFSKSGYKKTVLTSDTYVESGDIIYKIVADSSWQLILNLSESEYKSLQEKTYVDIEFADKSLETRATIETYEGTDGGYYACLTVDEYLTQYISDRFVNVRIENDQEAGYKIPKTSVVTKQYYKIPKSFLGRGGDSLNYGFFLQVIDETTGEMSIEFISPRIYTMENDLINDKTYDSDYVYVSTDYFEDGDIIMMNDSSAFYTISEKSDMLGVYVVNSGYCVFTLIERIDETDDYYIVSDSTYKGLSIYDHIILNGSLVSENQIVLTSKS